jgi:hypothetical protein
MADEIDPPDNPEYQSPVQGEDSSVDGTTEPEDVTEVPPVEPVSEPPRAVSKWMGPNAPGGWFWSLVNADATYKLYTGAPTKLPEKTMVLEAEVAAIEQLQVAADKQFDFIANQSKHLDDRRAALLTISFSLLAFAPTVLKGLSGVQGWAMLPSLFFAFLAALAALRGRMTSTLGSAMDIAGWVEDTEGKMSKRLVARARLAGTFNSSRAQIAVGSLFAAQINGVAVLLFIAVVALAATHALSTFVSVSPRMGPAAPATEKSVAPISSEAAAVVDRE